MTDVSICSLSKVNALLGLNLVDLALASVVCSQCSGYQKHLHSLNTIVFAIVNTIAQLLKPKITML